MNRRNAREDLDSILGYIREDTSSSIRVVMQDTASIELLNILDTFGILTRAGLYRVVPHYILIEAAELLRMVIDD